MAIALLLLLPNHRKQATVELMRTKSKLSCHEKVACAYHGNLDEFEGAASVDESIASYFIIGGDDKQYGPISGNDVREWYGEGRLIAQSSVRRECERDWYPLSALPEFIDLFAPPISSDAPHFYFVVGSDGKEYGPLSGGEVREWFAKGWLIARSSVRRKWGRNWYLLSTFPEFVDLFALPASGIPPFSKPTATANSFPWLLAVLATFSLTAALVCSDIGIRFDLLSHRLLPPNDSESWALIVIVLIGLLGFVSGVAALVAAIRRNHGGILAFAAAGTCICFPFAFPMLVVLAPIFLELLGPLAVIWGGSSGRSGITRSDRHDEYRQEMAERRKAQLQIESDLRRESENRRKDEERRLEFHSRGLFI